MAEQGAPRFPPRLLQAAGIKDLEEAAMLLEVGFGQLGFPLRLDHHREDIREEEAAFIIRSLGIADRAVLITYLREAEAIGALARALGVHGVQLHGEISAAQVKRLRTLVPHLGLIKSLVVKDDNREELAARVTAFTPYVDAFLTDTFDANTGACGATGRPHDWRISRALVELSRRPVILAGGLTAANVGRAVLQVGPAGVDVHTGIEGPDGRKDKALAAAFVAAARRAWQTSV